MNPQRKNDLEQLISEMIARKTQNIDPKPNDSAKCVALRTPHFHDLESIGVNRYNAAWCCLQWMF